MTSAGQEKGRIAKLVLASVLWGVTMLLATHFLYGVTWRTGAILWTIAAVGVGVGLWKWGDWHPSNKNEG